VKVRSTDDELEWAENRAQNPGSVSAECFTGFRILGRTAVAAVIDISREALLARRESILRRLDTTLPEFHALAISKVLSGDEWEALERLDAINFLLADEASPDAR
jgi:hypothetical protein